MKKLMTIVYTALLSAALCITALVAFVNESRQLMLPTLIAVFVIDAVLLIESIYFTVVFVKKKRAAGSRRKLKFTRKAVIGVGYTATAVTLCLSILCLVFLPTAKTNTPDTTVSSSTSDVSSDTSSNEKPQVQVPDGTLGTVANVEE
ncbi:MAG: hypothetical protein IIX60_03550, partial [Clostridia bacterium]|nr:hypothetical protein [Clostridia bacterium]